MPPNPEYKGREISEYKKDTKVIVNMGGEWTLARVLFPATMVDKKLQLEIEYKDKKNNLRTDVLLIDGDPPRIAKETDFVDPEKGAVHLTDPTPAEDGSIEYTVEYDGKKYTGVRQELLKLWEKSAKLGEKLKNLKTTLDSGSARKHLQFVEQNKAAEKMIADIFVWIREGKRIDTFDKTEIEKRRKTLSELIDQADEKISKLENEITLVDTDKDGEKAVAMKKLLKDRIENGKKKQQEKNLEEKNKKAQEKYVEDSKKWDAWQATKAKDPAAKKPKGVSDTKPVLNLSTVPDPLTPDQEDNLKKTVYREYFENPKKNEFKDQVLKEVERLRKQRAKNDEVSSQDEFEKSGEVVTDYKRPTDKSAYLNSKYFNTTTELFDQVLDKMENVDTNDFGPRFDQLSAKLQSVIDEIPLKPDKKPDTAYQGIHNKLDNLLKRVGSEGKAYRQFATAVAAGTVVEPKFVSKSKNALNQLEKDADDLERELRAVQTDQEVKDHKKTKKKEVGKEDEKHIPIISIPEHLMRELLDGRKNQVEAAITALFERELSEPSQGQAALEAFKDIFSDAAPDPALLEKLKKYGIRDWDHFKKLWDEKFADTMLRTMHEMAKALVRKEVAASITLRNKIGKLWGTLLGRAAISAALVGGSALALTTILGSGGLGGIAVAAAGGAAGGWMKSKVHEKLGGKFQEKVKEKMEELEHEKHHKVVPELVARMLAGATGTVAAKDKELPSFIAALTQGLRDITTEENKLKDKEAKEVEKLTGNARMLYEQILAHVDEQEPNEKIRNQLARAVLDLNGKGDIKQVLSDKHLDSKVAGALEKFFSAYSGKDGAGKSTAIGAMAGAAFFAGEGGARAVLGGLLGGMAGYKMAETAQHKDREKESREHVFADIRVLREFAKGQFGGKVLSPDERKKYQHALMRLKRLLHVSPGASLEELAVFGIVGREQSAEEKKEDHGHGHGSHGGHGHAKGGHGHSGGHGKTASPAHGGGHGHGKKEEHTGWVNAAGMVVIDKEGKMVDPELRFLFQDMRSAVNDAEEYGLLQEKPEDRQKMITVLEQVKKRNKEIEHEGHAHSKKPWYKSKKLWWTLGGVVAGVASAWGGKALLEVARGNTDGPDVVLAHGKYARSTYTDPLVDTRHHASAAGAHEHMAPVKPVGKPEVMPGPTHATSSSLDHPTSSIVGTHEEVVLPQRQSGPSEMLDRGAKGMAATSETVSTTAVVTAATHEQVAPVSSEAIPAGVHEVERPQVFVGEIKKGEGVLHGANRAIEKAIESGKFKIEGDVDGKITDAELRAWKITELKNMGFVFEKGKWGYPFTVHPGAEVVIHTDQNGNAHLAIIDDPKKVSHHEFIKFKDARGVASSEVNHEVVERARVTSKKFEREMITASRPDAPVHVGVKADPELTAKLADANGHMDGIVGVEARNDGGVSLELESGKLIGAFPELDPRLGTGMELDPNVPQWTLKPLEYAPGVSLPYENVGSTGKARLLDSDIPVKKSDAFLTREEYTKMVEGYKVSAADEPKSQGAQALPEKEVPPVPEKEMVQKSEAGIDKQESGPTLSEHRTEIRREFDQVNNTVKSRLDNLADTRYMSRADVKKDFLSDMQEMEGLVKNNRYDEIPIEKFRSLLKDTITDATAIERLFLAEDFQYPSVQFAGNSGALNIETEVIDGKPFSWAMLEISRNGQTTDYLFGVPEGYTLSVDNGVAKLVDAGGVPHGIKLSEDNLSHAFILPDDTRQARSAP